MTHSSHSLPARASAPRPPSRAPALVRLPGPLFMAMLRLGLPAGPNTVMTVRGRRTGEPRTVPIAVAEIDGRRYVIGAYGDVQWVRNLRAAGEATVRLRGRDVLVTAHELEHAEAAEFFGTTIPRYIGRFPWFGRAFARALFGLVGPELLNDPERAAETRPVFELRSA
jgi:deazaflavin-dependent oxidoreductase (nitroreductase family)